MPDSIRKRVRQADQARALRSSLRKICAQPEEYVLESEYSTRILNRLVYGWANPDWSADASYLQACIQNALSASGTIIECGTGLSTLLIGALIENKPSVKLVSLEHQAAWGEHIVDALENNTISRVSVVCRSLKDYGEFDWYDCEGVNLELVSLVICDGPPNVTRGGRFGCIPVLSSQLNDDCVILLDDCQRQEELDIIEQWSTSHPMSIELHGKDKKFAVLRLQPRH